MMAMTTSSSTNVKARLALLQKVSFSVRSLITNTAFMCKPLWKNLTGSIDHYGRREMSRFDR